MIFISAGHHPTKPGACHGSFCEHDEAMRWVRRIQALVGSNTSMLVPPMVLRDKAAYINARAPTLALEVRFNGTQGPTEPPAARTLYTPSNRGSKRLAQGLCVALAGVFKGGKVGTVEGWYKGDKSRGVDRYLAMLDCPTVVVEAGSIYQKETTRKSMNIVCGAIASFLVQEYRGAQHVDRK